MMAQPIFSKAYKIFNSKSTVHLNTGLEEISFVFPRISMLPEITFSGVTARLLKTAGPLVCNIPLDNFFFYRIVEPISHFMLITQMS